MTTRIEISTELRAEIIAAVEAANVTIPEQVCDWALDAAANGRDWQAEIASAVAADRN